jgi:hypothetical protein
LPGTYKAWLSGSAVDVASRFTHSSSPYVMVDGTRIADDWTDLTDGSLAAPITRDAHGVDNGLGGVWTATDPSGHVSYPGSTCSDWTYGSPDQLGADGYMGASHGDWSLNSVQPLDTCDVRNRLYCFEQPTTAPPPTRCCSCPGGVGVCFDTTVGDAAGLCSFVCGGTLGQTGHVCDRDTGACAVSDGGAQPYTYCCGGIPSWPCMQGPGVSPGDCAAAGGTAMLAGTCPDGGALGDFCVAP